MNCPYLTIPQKFLLKLDASVLAALQDGLADVQHLEPAEKLLEKLHLSIYHQRLQATDRCMEALLDFMKAFKPGRGEGKKDGGSGGV